MPDPSPHRLPRTALLSIAVPPGRSGQARVLGHHLARWPASALEIASPHLAHLTDYPAEARPWRYRPVAPAPPLPPPARGLRAIWRNHRLAGRLEALVQARARRLHGPLREARTQVLVACSGSPVDLPAASLLSESLGVPFAAYLFDDPVLQWPDPRHRAFTLAWERRWAGAADVVFVPNEVLAEDFRGRTGISPKILRNPVAPAAFGANSVAVSRAPRRLVYTGSVYHAQADALANVLAALASMKGAWTLEIYTSQPREQVEAYGLTGPHLQVFPHLDGDEVYAVQQAADAVLLPLGFETGITEVIRSSAPGKTAEYLACGRPLLVHAPGDCWVARLVLEADAGWVVPRPDPQALATALGSIVATGPASARVAQARRLAEEFRLEHTRARFEDWILALARCGPRHRRSP